VVRPQGKRSEAKPLSIFNRDVMSRNRKRLFVDESLWR